MRFPNGRKAPKNDGKKSQLVVRWTKPAHESPDLNFYWRMSDEDFNRPDHTLMKPDINLLMLHFHTLSGTNGKSLVDELKARGYDITTLEFTIEKLKP